MSFFVIATFAKSSYNWAMVTGLTVFVGLGIHSLGYAMIYVFFTFGIENGPSENYYVLCGLIIGMISLVIMTIFLNRIFKKNRCLITSNGLEVMH